MNGRERQVGVGRETQCGRGSLRQATRRPTRRIRQSFFSALCVGIPPFPSLRRFHSRLELLHHFWLERCALSWEIYTFPFVRTCRSGGERGYRLVQVLWPTCAPRRRASRPRYLARGKLLGETLKPFCSHRDWETCHSLSRCSAERGENARHSLRSGGVIAPVAFIAVIEEN